MRSLEPEVDPRTGRTVMPLRAFSVVKQIEFAAAAAQPQPPTRMKRIGLAEIPSRAYYEWFAERGVDYRQRRPGIPAWLRDRVLERDGNECGLCGDPIEEPPHIDHIRPVMHGGPTELFNLQVAHPSCNLAKGARC